jgi:hypothetical protein
MTGDIVYVELIPTVSPPNTAGVSTFGITPLSIKQALILSSSVIGRIKLYQLSTHHIDLYISFKNQCGS